MNWLAGKLISTDQQFGKVEISVESTDAFCFNSPCCLKAVYFMYQWLITTKNLMLKKQRIILFNFSFGIFIPNFIWQMQEITATSSSSSLCPSPYNWSLYPVQNHAREQAGVRGRGVFWVLEGVGGQDPYLPTGLRVPGFCYCSMVCLLQILLLQLTYDVPAPHWCCCKHSMESQGTSTLVPH